MSLWKRTLQVWLQSPAAESTGRGGCLRLQLRDSTMLSLAVTRLLAQRREGPALIIAASAAEADRLVSSLTMYAEIAGDSRAVTPLPALANVERRYWIPENEASRCAALNMALAGDPCILVAEANAVLSATVPPAEFERNTFTLKLNDSSWSPETLARRLVELDYDNEFEVNIPGEFARRGGVFDLFCPVYEAPVRIEFWGDTIDTMRFFDPETQRSFDSVDAVRVVPRGEMGSIPDGPTGKTFLDYLGGDVPIVACFPAQIREHIEKYSGESEATAFAEIAARPNPLLLVESGIPDGEDPFGDFPKTEFSPVGLRELIPPMLPELGESGSLWHRQQLRTQLQQWHRSQYTIVACCGNEGEADRFREVCRDEPLFADIPICIEPIPLDAAVLITEAKLALLSESELFGRNAEFDRKRSRRRRYFERAEEEAAELEEGGYAVHAGHGLCIYHGIQKVETTGELQEAIKLEFADDGILYVPLDQAHLVTRYVGGTRKLPRLSKLGGVAWRNAKENAAASAWDFAAELLRMDAVRRSTVGFSFAKASDWEDDFARGFPYTETEDQKQAIADVFEDMSATEPMDRLLCGDVGYGKTEVAMRAAFRAVMHGKQVAVLVPTTVLAQQHYISFRERMADYPVVISMLSRFRSNAEQNRTIRGLTEGTVDIVIGTHRLLGKDVVFADLGLVVIDEEQRFGVVHKEKLKRMRSTVDVLTMTATPIPRTLYFGISGIRNLSTIMTPPAERLPVTTVVAQYDTQLVREAILRELERDGQVFFLHNRVRTIGRMCSSLQDLVPEAVFEVGHGQMAPGELEEVMLRFISGKTDVLVSTTIIESGLDIRNANTIIIDRSDRFGLADLYQLRGRVGRYHHQAFAYFLLPPMGSLPQNARERLAAIRRYTHLGAGFKLALRDLEIRGAGNILGTEQSGHIAAVGFDVYCDLLREAVRCLEKRHAQQTPEVQVNLGFVAFALSDERGRLTAVIPPEYIDSEGVRVDCYRQLRQLTKPDQLDTFREELRDRFGPVPPEVDVLLRVSRLRVLAGLARITSVTVRDGRLFLETERGLLRDSRGKLPLLVGDTDDEKLNAIIAFLERRVRRER